MTRHLLTAALAGFWLAMVILLWRAETGLGHRSSPIPLDVVVDRILNASDTSQLRLLHHGKETGQLRWVSSIQERSGDPDPPTPEGMVRVVEGYRVDIDLNLHGETPAERWRVLAQVEFAPDQSVPDIVVRWMQRPMAWEVRMHAGSDRIEFSHEDGHDVRRSETFRVSDLARLKDDLGPVAALLPAPWPPMTGLADAAPGNARWVEWSASDEPISAGRHKLRAFKVRARVLGTFEVVAHVSRAGEILRVSLPGQFLLASTALPGLDVPAGPRRR